MTRTLDLRETSIVFISYDEPDADANFDALLDAAPHAQRVHGITGFDAAHAMAGDIAETPHVLTVDGDNRVLEPAFFDERLTFEATDLTGIVAFNARVAHNGLVYGNGGVKVWPRPLLRTLRTHEKAKRVKNAIDFVWRVPYMPAVGIPTETRVTGSPEQAFRAGFREGTRLSMHRGLTLRDAFPDLDPKAAFAAHVGAGNIERLRIWASVGRDWPNGDWAMLGARMGLASATLDRADIGMIADFGALGAFWRDAVAPRYTQDAARRSAIADLGARLAEGIGLDLADLDADASRFFKSTYRPYRALGRIDPI